MAKTKEIKMVPLNIIEPDANQPRKSFNAERLADLMKSIKRHGIMNPLSVERRPGGLYLLIDGERRYRASKELGLKEVPVIIEEMQDDAARLIQQFHLQEQHEGWSPLEKAVAVSTLSQTLNVNVAALAEMLSLPRSNIGDYVSFSKLLERKHFEKSEIPVTYASRIINLKNSVKSAYLKVLNEEFDLDRQKDLERAIIDQIKKGNITKVTDLNKLTDSVRMNPRSIEGFLRGLTVEKVFTDSTAKVARHYRNIVTNAQNTTSHVRMGVSLGVNKLFDGNKVAINILKKAHSSIGELIRTVKEE